MCYGFFCQDETLEARLTHPMVSLMKRSKALRFYGLMGRRSGGLKPCLCIKNTTATNNSCCFFSLGSFYSMSVVINTNTLAHE